MTKAFKLAIVRARHDDSIPTISDEACLEMVMTGRASVMKFWEESSGGYFDFLDSAMFPWVDITVDAAATGRSQQAQAAFAAVRAREPERDPLAGFDGAIVLTLPGRMTVPNPKAGQPGEPDTIVAPFDGGSTTLDDLPVSVLPVMSSNHTFMCHELGHTLGFEHTFGLDNNGTDWNPTDDTIIVGPEYGSPYDMMSAASFGSRWLGTGPLYNADPTFAGTVVNGWPFAGAAGMGPSISRANLHRWFPDALATQVIDRPFPGQGEIGRVRLAAAASGGAAQLLVLHPPDEQTSSVQRPVYSALLPPSCAEGAPAIDSLWVRRRAQRPAERRNQPPTFFWRACPHRASAHVTVGRKKTSAAGLVQPRVNRKGCASGAVLGTDLPSFC